MIIKSFEINKINFDQNKLVLFYGKNEGFKNEAINNLIKDKDEITKYEEKEVLENINDFIESILSKSLFESEKIIIIKRATDKILKIINEINSKNIEDIKNQSDTFEQNIYEKNLKRNFASSIREKLISKILNLNDN